MLLQGEPDGAKSEVSPVALVSVRDPRLPRLEGPDSERVRHQGEGRRKRNNVY